MKVWINGRKVGGQVTTNPTKVRKDIGGAGKPTIDDGTGTQVPLVGKDLYTGGLNWIKPVVDVSPYLVDGENTIVIEYSSALSNVQLDRGVIPEQAPRVGRRDTRWWHNDQVYLSFGPKQAKIVPFVDVQYGATVDVSAAPTPIMQGGKLFLSVNVTNVSAVKVGVVVTTPYGARTYQDIKPGKTIQALVNTNAMSIPRGHVTVKVTGVVGGQRVTTIETAYYAPYP
jgi:hypothetical protein